MSRLGSVGPGAPPPTKIAEGREAEIFDWGEHTVLRLYRDARAHDRAERELAALSAVRSALPCVPAPRERLDWQGRPGILMQRLDGRGVLAEIQRRPWRFWSLARLCGRVHAEVNGLRAPASLPRLKDDLRRRLEGAPGIPEALRAAALAELARRPDGEALCHGDFQPDNLLLCAAGPAVIDWPFAARGDPCADFARTALMTRLGSLPPGVPWLIRWGQWMGRGLFARAYAAGYAEATRYDAEAVRRWQFVRAVERLADEIPEERAALLRAAERLRPRPGVGPPGAP